MHSLIVREKFPLREKGDGSEFLVLSEGKVNAFAARDDGDDVGLVPSWVAWSTMARVINSIPLSPAAIHQSAADGNSGYNKGRMF